MPFRPENHENSPARKICQTHKFSTLIVTLTVRWEGRNLVVPLVMGQKLHITEATADDRAAAYRVLYSQFSLAVQTLRTRQAQQQFSRGGDDVPLLLIAKYPMDAAVVGAMMIQPLSATTVVVWPPRTIETGDRFTIETALATEALVRFRASGIVHAQALFSPDELHDGAALQRVGFQYLTRLQLYQREIVALDRHTVPSTELQFIPYTEADPTVFARTLLATYDGTLDCPELNNLHSIEDTVAAYLGDRGARPFCWLVGAKTDAVGVLILTAVPRSSVLEISYLGLIPAVRGRGMGQALINFTIRHGSSIGSTAVHLSVDRRNEPAHRLYLGKGFGLYDEREVLLWITETALRKPLKC